MKNNHTLLYRRGDEEVECTSEPVYFEIEFDQFSLHKKVIRSANDLNEGDETTFRTYTSIDGKGNLDGCVIHLISFDEIDNETFSTIYVSIAGVPEEQVKSSNGVSRYSIDMGERPENGWFEGELGNIFFQGEGEFADKSSIRAVLYLSEDRFAQLVEDLQGGGVTNMRLEVGADLFKFNYESMGIGLPNHKFNYAFLREESGKNR